MTNLKQRRRVINLILLAGIVLSTSMLFFSNAPWQFVLNGLGIGGNLCGLIYNRILFDNFRTLQRNMQLTEQIHQNRVYHQTRANEFVKELLIQERELQQYKDIFGDLPKM